MSSVSFTTTAHKRVDAVEISGRIDSSNAHELESVLKGFLDNKRYSIVLEMSEVTYISSAGVRILVSALRTSHNHRGDVRIAHPSQRVREVLSLAGLEAVFKVYENMVDAVGSF